MAANQLPPLMSNIMRSREINYDCYRKIGSNTVGYILRQYTNDAGVQMGVWKTSSPGVQHIEMNKLELVGRGECAAIPTMGLALHSYGGGRRRRGQTRRGRGRGRGRRQTRRRH